MQDMHTLIRIAAIAATLVYAVPAQFGAADAAQEHEPENTIPRLRVTLHDADPRWAAAIATDIDRFERAGLQPVVADVHVWDRERTDQCNGHAGYFTPTGGVRRVDLCIDFIPGDLGEELRRKLVLHELAHAWIHVHSDDDQQRAERDEGPVHHLRYGTLIDKLDPMGKFVNHQIQ